MSSEPMNIAVLVSGSGTNLQAIIDAINVGDLDARIVYVVASNPDAYGIERAKAAGLDVIIYQRGDYDNPEALDAKMAGALKAADVEYLAMAGYMRKVTPVLLGAFPNRIVNLHPALLPKYVGAHAIQDAWDAGDEVTGITFHFANEEYDQGPIIFQHEVRRMSGDSIDDLEARIHDAEHEYYPKVLQLLAVGRVKVVDGRVEISD